MADENKTTAALEEMLRKQIAKGNKLAGLGFMLLMADKYRSESRCEVEAIEKVTTAIPDASSVTTIEQVPSISPVVNPPIFLPGLIDTGKLTSAIAGAAMTSAGKQVVIGRDFETGADVAVGDKEREGGFYILGEPRTGKSTLLVSMALQDIQNGHGLLFIDPHYKAINDLLERIPEQRLKDVRLLDPMDQNRSFGLNLLHCPDPRNEIELDNAVGRVRNIFTKAWGGEAAYLGLWLDKILSNSVYLLLENPDPGYTLVDIPFVVDEDTTFRNELLNKVKVTTAVQDFWYRDFDRLTRRDRTEQVGPALTRLNSLRTNHILRGIVGQKESTIDFSEILRTGKIVLLRMPSNLDKTVQNLIGTLVLSEFLYAVHERGKLKEDERPYFGVYCDEFQRFATPDFADLFMETGKFKVMPVVAHQTREQFKSRDDPNRGATAASRSKVFFTLSPVDAKEMALVVTKEPPTETVYEQQVVISHDPVRDLLTGRHKPEIQEFVDKYLRHLQWRREDTREEIEGERLLRLSDLDEASLYGVDERMAYIDRYPSGQVGALESRGEALMRAQARTQNLLALHEASNRLRLTFRGLNTFFIDVMEGKKKPGQEPFSDFLISVIGSYSRLSQAHEKILELYIKVSYGDNSAPRLIPFGLGEKIALFASETKRLTQEAAGETARQRNAFEKRYKQDKWEYFYSRRKDARMRRQSMKNIIAKTMTSALARGQAGWDYCSERADSLRMWPVEGERVLAEAIADLAGRGSVASVYFENYYSGNWYELDHFVPKMNYENSCALDFGAERPGKEPLVVLQKSKNARSYMNSATEYNRKDVFERKKVLQERWSYFSQERPAAARIWKALDAASQWYLLMRACDLVMYGFRFADLSFPEPSNSDYRWVVSSLVWLFTEHEGELVKKREDAEEAEERKRIERDCAESVAKILVSPPVQLKPRVLEKTQREEVRAACAQELRAGGEVGVVGTIDDFASFCSLLAKPENHIRIKGQYVEKQKRARAEIDMVNEAARLLSSVERHAAYVRLEKRQGAIGAWTGKVWMKDLEGVPADALAKAQSAIEPSVRNYTRLREEIRQEIEKRQEPWRRVSPSRPQAQAQRAVRPASKPVEPPPTRTSTRLPGDR